MTDRAAPRKRLILIFAGPRSGSNYLVDILSKVPGAIALSEIFNPRAVFGLNLYPEIEAQVLADFGSEDELWRALRMAPDKSLSRLLAAVPADSTVFVKVLPNQAPKRALRRILQDHAAGAIFLTRNRLDQYVSLRKANEGGAWFRENTTELRPVAHLDAFLSWTTVLEDWQRDMTALCGETGIVRAHLNYERDLKSSRPSDIAERLCARLAMLRLAVTPDDLSEASWFTRQDTADDPFDKICNGADLRRDLARFDYLEKALTAPDLDAEPARQDKVPDLIADPLAGAELIREGDFGTLHAAMGRIGRDVAPGLFRPRDLSRAENHFERFTFICGLHRSGTTLLHDWIAARHDIATLRHDSVPRSEGQFLQDVLPQEEPFGGPGHFAFAPQMVPSPVRDRRLAAKWFDQMCGSWAAHADRPDHAHLLEKSPTNLTRIAWLRSVFPDARFVVLVRDPRAVALATQKWRAAPLELLLAHWQAAHLAALSQMAGDCHVVRYEDFCADPETELQRIAAFCGLTPRAAPGVMPEASAEIRESTADYLRDWPEEIYFAPNLKVWELFGYRF